MLNSGFWTLQHITGVTLIVGCLLFLSGAGSYGLIRDEKGRMIFGQPPRAWVTMVHDHPALWRRATLLFISGTLLTVAGLAGLTDTLEGSGTVWLARISLLAFVIAAVLWVILLTFRLTVDPWAGEHLARTNTMPDTYEPLRLWIGPLFVIYTVLMFLGLALLGVAVLGASLLPQWCGWLAIVYGIAGLGLLAAFRDAPLNPTTTSHPTVVRCRDMTTIACIGHWYTDLLYFAPILIMVGLVGRDKLRRRRAGNSRRRPSKVPASTTH